MYLHRSIDIDNIAADVKMHSFCIPNTATLQTKVLEIAPDNYNAKIMMGKLHFLKVKIARFLHTANTIMRKHTKSMCSLERKRKAKSGTEVKIWLMFLSASAVFPLRL